MKCAEHDIHADNTEVVVEKDGIDDKKEEGSGKYWMHGPTLVTKLEVGIIQGRDQEFVVKITNVRASTSSFTNMQILDEEHATEIYER